MGEEAQKRNTDCVYFLASPLTCKKGINCEFRHSEAARLHPRDCRYWLGGNCLNANCPFRHPPLDGRPAAASAAMSAAPSKVALAPSVSATSLLMPANKPRTPCYFFSQGYCSKGDRCNFLHGPLLVPNAQATVVQKPPKAPTCKEVKISDRPMNVGETNGPTIRSQGSKLGAGKTSVHSLPSNVFLRAQETPRVDNDKHRESEGPRTSLLSSKHQTIHLASIEIHNPLDMQKRRLSVEQIQHQRVSTDDHRCVEARQQQSLAQGERIQNGTRREQRIQNGSWKDGLFKEASLGFVQEEFDNSVDRESDKGLPYFPPYLCASSLSPRKTNCQNDAHNFGTHAQDRSRHHGSPFSSEHDSYECFDQLHQYDCLLSYSESRDRRHSPAYSVKKDRYRITGDLRDRLGKRRYCAPDQVSDINGHIEGFQATRDYDAHFDERGWDDSFPRRIEGGSCCRRFGRADHRGVQPPIYDFRLDGEGDNAVGSFSGGSPMRLPVGDYPKRKLINSEGSWNGSRRAMHYVELDVLNLGAQSRSAHTRLESRAIADNYFRAQGTGTLRSEVHAGSYSSFVEHPSIESRVLPASCSNVGERGPTLSNEFEGPKPLSVLLQEKRKIKGDGGKAGSDKEEDGTDRVCSEKTTIVGRKRKQKDSFGLFSD